MGQTGPGARVRTVVIDDLIADALAYALRHESRVEVVGAFTCPVVALERLPALEPDVAVVDLRLPGSGMTGIEVIVKARVRLPRTRFALYSISEDPADRLACAALKVPFLEKSLLPQGHLLAAILAIHAGLYVATSTAAADLLQPLTHAVDTTIYPLSTQERRALELWANLDGTDGSVYKEIGRRMERISPGTVQTYLQRARVKLNVTTVREAAAVAQRLGLI